MLRAWPLLAVSLLLGALALACGDGAGQPPTPSPSPTLAPTPMTFEERPEITISPDKKYFATVDTAKGAFRIELRPDLAIQTVNSFIFLARQGFYDGVTFHRVIPGFVAQGGDPTGTGSGDPGYTLPAEFSDVSFERGTVGMARGNDPDSGGSQFFIAYAADVYDDVDESGDASAGDIRLTDVGPYPEGSTVADGDADIGVGLTTVSSLNGQYTVFGKVIEGMEVVDSLTPRDPSNIATPQPPGDTIISIEIEGE
jgi:peptidylprolyl isomerase